MASATNRFAAADTRHPRDDAPPNLNLSSRLARVPDALIPGPVLASILPAVWPQGKQKPAITLKKSVPISTYEHPPLPQHVRKRPRRHHVRPVNPPHCLRHAILSPHRTHIPDPRRPIPSHPILHLRFTGSHRTRRPPTALSLLRDRRSQLHHIRLADPLRLKPAIPIVLPFEVHPVRRRAIAPKPPVTPSPPKTAIHRPHQRPARRRLDPAPRQPHRRANARKPPRPAELGRTALHVAPLGTTRAPDPLSIRECTPSRRPGPDSRAPRPHPPGCGCAGAPRARNTQRP